MVLNNQVRCQLKTVGRCHRPGTQVSGYALLAGLAIAGLGAGTASAQDNQPGPASGNDAKSAVQEVIVSARRKDEKLTDVPVSITAMSSDLMDKQNIQSFTDYATKVPNLTFSYGQGADASNVGFSGGRQTTIRGIVGANTTAYYLNDTPVPETVSPQTLGLDRIEVLKGPQGTLFGASSMGGNVRFITKKPSLTQNESSIEAQAGGTEGGGFDTGGNALTNVVLVPNKVALNVAVGDQSDSGFITRAFPDASGNLVKKGGQGANNDLTGMVTLRLQLTDQLEASLSGMGEVNDLHGFPAAYVPLPAYRPDSYTVYRDHDLQEYSQDRWGLGSLVLTYSGTGYSVISSTSYFSRKVKEQEDDSEGFNQYYDGIGIDLGNPVLYMQNIQHERRITQETRIAFDDGTLIPHLSGVGGVFYQQKDGNFSQPGIDVPALSAAGFPQDYLNQSFLPSHEQNMAVFGELYYEVLPKLTLTFGLRHYWISQKFNADTFTGTVNQPGGQYVPEADNYQAGFVPKGVVSYKIDDNGTLYASASKGFRVGGATPALPTFCAADLAALGMTEAQAEHFKPDSLWSYEIGAKDQVAGGRLNVSAAGFQIDWSQVQQSVTLPTCAVSFTGNAGRARIRGGELEVSGRPFSDIPLTIQFGVGYANAMELDPGFLPQAPNTRLTQVPKWTETISGYYETPVSDTVDLFVGADYSYTGAVQVNNVGGYGFLTRQPFNILNGNVGLRFESSSVSIYGKNLLNEHLNYGDLQSSGFVRQQQLPDGTFQRLPMAAVSRPLQLGVQYKMDF